MNIEADVLMDEIEAIDKDLWEALDTIDDMVNRIGKIIIDIAVNNDDFICTGCLRTAEKLYLIMKKYAREEDSADTLERFKKITGRDLYE